MLELGFAVAHAEHFNENYRIHLLGLSVKRGENQREGEIVTLIGKQKEKRFFSLIAQ